MRGDVEVTNIQIDFSPEKGVASVYGQSMLFHCNHYNRFLQQTIEDPAYIDSEKILLQAAAETVYLQFSELFKKRRALSFQEKLNLAARMFQFAGFGILDFSKVSEKGGKVVEKSSHFGLAVKLNFSKRETPAEVFDKGFVAGVLCAIGEGSKDSIYRDGFGLKQTKSISLGDDCCEYEIVAKPKYAWLKHLKPKKLPSFVTIPPRKMTTTVNEELIVRTLAGMEIVGDADGLIPAFGVYLTRMYADYYNKISFQFEKELARENGGVELANSLLIEAGHICGFNTMGGIMKSDEWKGLILPMIKNKEDWMHGIVACINAIGWGVWRIEELTPGNRLVMRIYEGYESIGHLKWFGKADHPIDYLATGVSAALMNLLYHGDITKNPVLDKDYYYHIFKEEKCFKGKQIKCLAMGDDYSEVVVAWS